MSYYGRGCFNSDRSDADLTHFTDNGSETLEKSYIQRKDAVSEMFQKSTC